MKKEDTKELLTISSFAGASQVSVCIEDDKDLLKVATCLLKVFIETPELSTAMQEIMELAIEKQDIREALESNVIRVPNFNDLLKN